MYGFWDPLYNYTLYNVKQTYRVDHTHRITIDLTLKVFAFDILIALGGQTMGMEQIICRGVP